MSGKRKQLSNTSSTGHLGPHFEAHVLASYATLMLTRGYAPCLRCWPIKEIKPQGKVDGYETDDLIVFVQAPGANEVRKLLGQVKHGLKVGDNERFRSVMQAAWDDFQNPKVFIKGKDIIAAISDGLSSVEITAVQAVLDEARNPSTKEFIRRVELGRYNSGATRGVLNIFRETLKKANNNKDLSSPKLHDFLKHFRLLGYDLGKEEGVVLSLLHSHISQCSDRPPQDLWARILEYVQNCNQSGTPINMDTVPEDIREAFRRPPVETIPTEITSLLAPPSSGPSVYTYSNHLAQAFLLGGWNESSEGDIDIISEFAKEEYANWVLPIRNALETQSAPLSLQNGTWKTKRSLNAWKRLGKKLYDDDLDSLERAAIKVLSTINPAFELPADERYMASVLGKIPRYSQSLREGIADALALMGSNPQLFEHCSSSKPQSVALLVVRQILDNADWQTWASIGDLLTLLAEASPDEFLAAVENALQQNPCPLHELFAQEGMVIMGTNYMTGLLWALETLAWDEKHLTRVAVILGELATIDPGGNWGNRPKNSLTTIFLPWLPQTTAPVDKRLVAIRTLFQEAPEAAWETLTGLLPNHHQMSFGSHKPRWRMAIPDSKDRKISMQEYWQQVSCYADLAIQAAQGDVDKLRTLIDVMENLPPDSRDNLLLHLSSETVKNLPEEERTTLWSTLITFITDHRRVQDSDKGLKTDTLDKITKITDQLSPKALQNLHRRIFTEHDIELYDEYDGDDWDEKEKKLEAHRQQAIADICHEGGIDAVLRFVLAVESPPQVGAAFGAIAGLDVDTALLPGLLMSEDDRYSGFISSYVWARRWTKDWDWVDDIITVDWTADQICSLLRKLPFCPETWKRVAVYLGSNEALYWEKVVFNAFQAKDDYETAIDKLLEYGRPYAAIECLSASSHQKRPLDRARTTKALLEATKNNHPPNQHIVRKCVQLIEALQEDPETDQDALFRIEWAYLRALDGNRRRSRPKCLEQRLASDPAFFCEVIRLVFRSRHENKPKEEPTESERRFATQAFYLLHAWRVPPGTLFGGSFSSDAFQAWMNSTRDTCQKTGHLEVAMSQVGQVLIYAPSDPEGLWIHKAVAEALNAKDAEEIRRGFHTGVFNSRGVHSVDPTGQPEKELADKFKNQAEAVEKEGFFRLATTMRHLSETYTKEAERIIADHHQDHQESNSPIGQLPDSIENSS